MAGHFLRCHGWRSFETYPFQQFIRHGFSVFHIEPAKGIVVSIELGLHLKGQILRGIDVQFSPMNGFAIVEHH